MSYPRRLFIAGSGLLLLGGLKEAISAEPPLTPGRTPITRREWDSLIGTMGKGGVSCERTPEGNEGPFYSESSPERRTPRRRRGESRRCFAETTRF